MTWDDAGHGLLAGNHLAHANGHVAAGAKPTAARCVVDLQSGRPHPEQVGGLECPGKLLQRRAAPAPGVDLRQRLVLVRVGALVDVQEVGPGRAFLVIGVARGEHHPETCQLDPVGLSRGDLPRKGPEADPVCGAPPVPPPDPPAGTDRLTVAGLEIGSRELPVGHGGRAYRGTRAALVGTLSRVATVRPRDEESKRMSATFGRPRQDGGLPRYASATRRGRIMSRQRLTALDASFLEVENPRAHMHVGW